MTRKRSSDVQTTLRMDWLLAFTHGETPVPLVHSQVIVLTAFA